MEVGYLNKQFFPIKQLNPIQMLFSANFLVLPSLSPSQLSNSREFPYFRPLTITNHFSLSAQHKPWITRLSQQPEEGPIELPSSSIPSLFATNDDPTILQTTTSVLLTGAISIFLFRSLRRRAKRAKELKYRSSGVKKKTFKDEAMGSLKSVTLSPVNAKAPPSPVQTFLGALTAGVIALILYKFTTTIEASLSRQTISDSYQVRQITVTIRTIINGLCYLATFVFGANAIGLLLYSGQLAFNSFMDDSDIESEATASSSSNKESSNSSLGDKSTKEKSSDNTE